MSSGNIVRMSGDILLLERQLHLLLVLAPDAGERCFTFRLFYPHVNNLRHPPNSIYIYIYIHTLHIHTNTNTQIYIQSILKNVHRKV